MTWVWSKMINPLKCKLEIVLLIIHKLPTYNKAADYETPWSNETLESAVVAVIHKTFFDIQKLYSIKVLPYSLTSPQNYRTRISQYHYQILIYGIQLLSKNSLHFYSIENGIHFYHSVFDRFCCRMPKN